MQPYNLNELKIEDHCDRRIVPLRDFSIDTPQVDVVFKSIEQRLIKEIEAATAVVGCVAWLTSIPVLEALSQKNRVSIVVQKEDFLRPDNCGPGKQRLLQLYGRIPACERWDFLPSEGLSCAGDPTLHAIRCVGNSNTARAPSHPRAHHKFVVFLRESTFEDLHVDGPSNFTAYQVWTGSFNFTRNATLSFENAVIIRTPKIVSAFYQEWGQILALSEPLDWESPWVAPEWRLGS